MVLLVTVEQAAASLCAAIERAQSWLSHPAITVLQFHGIWLVILLATLWVLAGKARLRELQRQRRRTLGRPAGALAKSSGSKGSLGSLVAEQEVRGRPNGVGQQPQAALLPASVMPAGLLQTEATFSTAGRNALAGWTA